MQTRWRDFPSKIGICGIGIYRNLLSANMLHSCKFFPSCSAYAKASIALHGLFLGGLQTVLRIIRCSPLSKGGFDPVINERLK